MNPTDSSNKPSLFQTDPLAVFLASPGSHLSDILYLYFRIYKKRILWRFFKEALQRLNLSTSDEISISDVGASMGFDPIYLLRMLTESFSQPLPFKKVRLELIEGDSDLIAEGESFPIYGHINLNPTRVWEKIAQSAGFKIRNYGTYESIRRGGGSKSPSALAFYFLAGAFVYHLLPPRLGRFFGDSTALLLEKPKTVVA